MALSARFTVLNANFDRFLFSSIGKQENNMPLSVASALARAGTDPWAEAERLANLPREKAAEALAAVVVRMSPARVAPSEALGIATRLAQLLPSAAESSSAVETRAADWGRGWTNKLVLLLCLALLAVASFNLLA